jgi:hypothetical protein
LIRAFSVASSAKGRLSCRVLRGWAIGTKYSLRRRPSLIVDVNAPLSSKAQWRLGGENGELRIGSSGEAGILTAWIDGF